MKVQVGPGATLVINGVDYQCKGALEFEVDGPARLPEQYRNGWVPGSDVTLTLTMNEDIAAQLIADIRSGKTVAIREERA